MSGQNSTAPDEKKVLVAMTGRLDSLVAAYLLKKQGYRVQGLGISFKSELKKEHWTLDDDGNPVQPGDFEGIYLLDDLEKVKAQVEKINIPFYAADASGVYQNCITDHIVSSRLEGISFAPRIHATELIFKILVEKADRLGCRWISSGHYAKILNNKTTGNYHIHMSNDSRDDQSYFLSRLTQNILKRALLPLSDMRRREVRKIADSLGITPLKPKIQSYDIVQSTEVTPFIVERMPPSMAKRDHSLIDAKTGNILTDHNGIHLYFLGQKNLKQEVPVESDLTVTQISYITGNIHLTHPDDIETKHLMLKDFFIQGQLDITRPLDVLIKTQSQTPLLPATLYFKNNDYVLLELGEPQKNYIFPGHYCVIYSRSDKDPGILAGGVVKIGGVIEHGVIRNLPRVQNPLEDEPETKPPEPDGFHF